MLGALIFYRRTTDVYVQATRQVVGRHYYCSHEVPPGTTGWLEGGTTWSLVHSNQPVESKWVTC